MGKVSEIYAMKGLGIDMKKVFVALILLFMLSVVAYSFADTIFQLRNNIEFGMTLSEVEKLETLPRDKNSLVPYFGYGKIANIDYSGVQYHFENKKLKEVEFNFDELHKRGIFYAIQDYGDISTLLNSKYGTPLGNKDGKTSVLRGSEFDSFITIMFIFDSMDYEEWLIKVDGGYVKIDHFLAQGKETSHMLSYTFFSDKEVNQLTKDI